MVENTKKACVTTCVTLGESVNNSRYEESSIILLDAFEKCLHCFDPAADKVTRFRAERIGEFMRFNAVFMDSYIYILYSNQSVHRLDIRDSNSKWERMRDTITCHGLVPPAVALSRSIFVIGTEETFYPTTDVEKFDPDSNQWLRLTDKPEAISGVTLVSLDNSIYCIGGWDGIGCLASVIQFTPSSSGWVDLEPMRFSRAFAGAVAINKNIFVVGGSEKVSMGSNNVECYDVSSNQWTSLSPMIGKPVRTVAHYYDGWIISVPCNSSLDDMEKYHIAKDRWYRRNAGNMKDCWVDTSVSVSL